MNLNDIACALALTPLEVSQLADILRCKPNELASRLSLHASAALQEYVQMFLGQKVLRRGSDQQEYRLFLLISHAFGNKLPDEQEVSRLFQTTTTESRALIRSVMSKYQYQLREAIDASLKTVCETARAEEPDGDVYAVIQSTNAVDELNRILAEIDGSLPPIQRRRNSVSTYLFKPSAHQALCNHFGVQQKSAAADG